MKKHESATQNPLRHRSSAQASDSKRLRGRIAALQTVMRQQAIGVAWIVFSRDVLYYSGTAQPSFLVVLQEDYYLFVRHGIHFALHESFIEPPKIMEERKLDRIKSRILPQISCKCLGTQLDILPVAQVDGLREVFSDFKLINISPIVLEQRKRKAPAEIDCIREACRAVHAGYEAVRSHLKPGISELELAAAVEYAHRLAGHEGTFFFRHPDFYMSTGPMASGGNLSNPSGALLSLTGIGLSAAVPAGPSLRRIKQGDLLIVDIPALVKGYHADQTRTYALGKAPKEAHRMFQAILTISDYLIDLIRPGIRASEVYTAAVRKAEQLGVADRFLSLGNGRKSHLVGHGVGLECNEPPLLALSDQTIIDAGFVLAIELHILDPAFGAVKLEDMILVTDTGCEILTTVPRKLIETPDVAVTGKREGDG
jgi:Xaa-Pro aminopeptidase